MVAWSALVVAALSLSWQLYYALRVDRPRLRAKVAEMEILPAGTKVIAITVTNTGRRATVLQTAHLTLGKPRRVRDHVWPQRLRRSYGLLPFAHTDLPELNTAEFPQRLDPGDEVSVYVQRQLVVTALRECGERWIHVRATASTARSRTSRPIRIDPSTDTSAT